MTGLLHTSIAALVLLLLLQFRRLRSILDDTAMLKWIYEPAIDNRANPLDAQMGLQLPDFEVRVLDSLETLSSDDLNGDTHAFVFLTMGQDERALSSGVMAQILTSIWTKVNGVLCIVCIGDQSGCRRFVEETKLSPNVREATRIVVDRHRKFTNLLGIVDTPSSIVVDEECRIRRVGGLH